MCFAKVSFQCQEDISIYIGGRRRENCQEEETAGGGEDSSEAQQQKWKEASNLIRGFTEV